MARTKVQQTGSYQAVDAQGVQHTIYVYTNFIEVAPLSGPHEWVPGTQSHKMRNGNHVNVNDDGTLEDVHTGRTMRRV